MSTIESLRSDAAVVEAEPLLQGEARRLTDQIRLGLEGVWELAVRAWEGQAWLALGYPSWGEYCTRELGSCMVRLPVDDHLRAAAWRPMVEAGMSQGAIASVAGLHRKTVASALRSAPRPPSARVVGLRGETRPASRPTRADVLIRQANAARLRSQGQTQQQIAAELGVAQATVSADLAQIDKLTSALEEEVDASEVLADARDESGRTDVAAVAGRFGVAAAPSKNLSRLVRQPARDLEATLRVVVNEVVLADEWLDPAERAAALEVLMPTTARLLEQVRQIVAALPQTDRQGQQWRAVCEAIDQLEREGHRA